MSSKRVPSLRTRVTLFATGVVAIALIAAASGLVFAVERTLLGRLENEAVDQLERIASAVEAGQDPAEVEGGPAEVMVQVIDDQGNVVDVVPGGNEAVLRQRIQIAGTPGLVAPGPGAVHEPGTIVVRQLDRRELILAQKTVESPAGERTVVAISPFSGAAHSVDTVVSALWIGTPFLIAFVGLVCWYFAGRTLRPVDAITQRADEISHTTLSDRLPRPGTDDEIDRLAVTLNSMLERLDEAARRQRAFVSDASHELRSPIAAIKTQIEVAMAHPESSHWTDVGSSVLSETRRLEGLVDDILTLARADEVGAERLPVDLADLVRGEVARVNDDRVRIRVQPVVTEVDRDQIERALSNLLSNARRHANARIDVSLRVMDDQVHIIVDDDGPGVPAEDRERVFERFARLDAARGRATGGFGIGLAVVRRVALLHHGEAICSDSPLGGARFEVVLPRHPEGSQQPQGQL
jgi:signal transduction histidine kinase